MKPSLAEIGAFVAIVDEGTVTGAARVRGKSVSATSEQLKQFELQAGGSLLRSVDRQLVPTARGWKVYLRCMAVLAAHESIFDE